jgi:hypothetical protein
MKFLRILSTVTLIGLAIAALASPASASTYSLLTTIALPTTVANTQLGGAFTSFDLSYIDPTTQRDYVTDRSNAVVDIISTSTFSVLGQAGGFTGQQATTSTSGPNGVVAIGSSLFAGNGNSTVLSFNVSNPAAPTPLLSPIATGGTFRADEMAYSPTFNSILVANNADTPPFATLFNATTGAVLASHITIPGTVASSGLEHPVWDPNTGTFFINVPTISGVDAGGIAEISTAGAVLHLYNLGLFGIASCAPTGLALGGSGNLMIGCGNSSTQTIVLNPTASGGNGAIVTTIAGISGSDQLAYDPTLGDFFVTGTNAGLSLFDVISDSTYSIVDSVLLPNVNAHSIAVDPLTNDVFVPLEGTIQAAADSLCPLGCVAVYATTAPAPTPEPSSLSMLGAGLISLMAAFAWRRRYLPAERPPAA